MCVTCWHELCRRGRKQENPATTLVSYLDRLKLNSGLFLQIDARHLKLTKSQYFV